MTTAPELASHELADATVARLYRRGGLAELGCTEGFAGATSGLGLPQPAGLHEICANRTRLVTPSTLCVRTVIDSCRVSAGAIHARL